MLRLVLLVQWENIKILLPRAPVLHVKAESILTVLDNQHAKYAPIVGMVTLHLLVVAVPQEHAQRAKRENINWALIVLHAQRVPKGNIKI